MKKNFHSWHGAQAAWHHGSDGADPNVVAYRPLLVERLSWAADLDPPKKIGCGALCGVWNK